MSERKQTVEVEIYGQHYNLRYDKDPKMIQSVASFVDRKMREIAQETSTVDSLKVAILAALNIADEMYELKIEAQAIEDVVAERADRIAGLLEKELEGFGAPKE